jgi:hypothetical protein
VRCSSSVGAERAAKRWQQATGICARGTLDCHHPPQTCLLAQRPSIRPRFSSLLPAARWRAAALQLRPSAAITMSLLYPHGSWYLPLQQTCRCSTRRLHTLLRHVHVVYRVDTGRRLRGGGVGPSHRRHSRESHLGLLGGAARVSLCSFVPAVPSRPHRGIHSNGLSCLVLSCPCRGIELLSRLTTGANKCRGLAGRQVCALVYVQAAAAWAFVQHT